jgi:hypothetical protein
MQRYRRYRQHNVDWNSGCDPTALKQSLASSNPITDAGTHHNAHSKAYSNAHSNAHSKAYSKASFSNAHSKARHSAHCNTHLMPTATPT